MTVVSVEHLSKAYRLGQIGTGTLSHDLNVWWARARGKPNPLLRVGQKDDDNRDGETIWALRDVSLEVKRGEVLGIIGRNGAGKSTILKVLSQITAPTEGHVKVKGRIASLLEVGTGFHPELTGRENIYLNGAILGMKKAEIARKFDEIVAFSEVEQFIDTPVKRYSSGMYVRLAFAVAAHLDPEILLIDEVLAVGDAAFQQKCLTKMGDVARGGRTVMFVSHNMSAIRHLCDVAAIVKSGKIHYIGGTAEAVRVYHDAMDTGDVGSLADRVDRVGDGTLRITKVSLADSDNRPLSIAVSGKTVRVTIEYQADRQRSEVDFAVAFFTRLGEPLFLCSTAHSGRGIEVLPGHGKITCEIESLPLTSGVYRLDLSAMRGNNTIHDWIQNTCRFEVQTVDYFDTGSDFSVGTNPFLGRSNWRRG